MMSRIEKLSLRICLQNILKFYFKEGGCERQKDLDDWKQAWWGVWQWGGMDGGQTEERGVGKRGKWSRGAGEGRVTFTVRPDQFPLPSIIDVTNMVGCYLSGLTDRNTIPTGRPHTHTQKCQVSTHTHTWSIMYKLTLKHTAVKETEKWNRKWKWSVHAASPRSHSDGLMSLMLSFIS